MKNKFVIFLITLTVIVSCESKKNEISKIEISIVDSNFINKQIVGFDSIKIDSINDDKNIKTFYYLKDSVTIYVLQDSLHRIKYWFKDKNGIRLDGAEVYETTGQIMGKLIFVKGIIEGTVTYYYQDGRVKSNGVFKNGHWYGEWKNYNPIGQLETIDYYDNLGKIQKTDTILKYRK